MENIQPLIDLVRDAIDSDDRYTVSELIRNTPEGEDRGRLIRAAEEYVETQMCQEGEMMVFVIPVMGENEPEKTVLDSHDARRLEEIITEDARIDGCQRIYLSDALYRQGDLPSDIVDVKKFGQGLLNLSQNKPATYEVFEAMESVDVVPSTAVTQGPSLRFLVGIGIGLEPKIWKSIKTEATSSLACRDAESMREKEWQEAVRSVLGSYYHPRLIETGSPAFFFEGIRKGDNN